MHTTFRAEDTTYKTLVLKEKRYSRNEYATLQDDGIVDPVAVERLISGHKARATPRELVCAVYEGATRGLDDATIAARLGMPSGQASRSQVSTWRVRARIARATIPLDGDYIAELILNPSTRARRPDATLRAAGIREDVIAANGATRQVAA